MDTTTREFARNFAHYRRIAARGEPVRISAPDGVFLLTRESQGMTGADLLGRLNQLPPGRGIFAAGGADRIAMANKVKTPARSPWDV